MNLSYDKETGLVTWTLMYEDEEITTESNLEELEELREKIDNCLSKHSKPKLSDKELYRQMQNLINAADEKIDKWRNENKEQDNEKTYEEYENYQSYRYGQIWDKFWELHNKISVSIDWCDPDTTYYEDIMACFKAYQEVEWMINIDS